MGATTATPSRVKQLGVLFAGEEWPLSVGLYWVRRKELSLAHYPKKHQYLTLLLGRHYGRMYPVTCSQHYFNQSSGNLSSGALNAKVFRVV